MAKGTSISIYLSDAQAEALAARTRGGRGERSEAVRRMIARYLEIVDADRPRLSRAEWSLCADALNGTWLHDTPSHWAMASIEDHIRLNAADTKWKVGALELREKLARLSRGGWVALVDMVERFWLAGDDRVVELPDD
jgi:hypothetical protein